MKSGEKIAAWNSGFASRYHALRFFARGAIGTPMHRVSQLFPGNLGRYFPIAALVLGPLGIAASAAVQPVPMETRPSVEANSSVTYNIKRGTKSGGPYTLIVSGIASPHFADTSVAPGTTYYYVVTAVTAGGESPNSVEASATTPVTTPPSFTSEPQNQSMAVGSNVVFAVSVAAGPVTTLQWYLNGRQIPGATDPILEIQSVSSADAGAYTCVATNSGGSTSSNAATLAVYTDASPGPLVNLSARAYVGTASNHLIAGFVVAGSHARTVLIRGVGPGLTPFGVQGVLPNPVLVLHTTSGSSPHDVIVASNTGWGGDVTLAASFTQVGAFSLSAGSSDSALLITLAPGAYTAEVSDANNATGVALAEVYELP